MTTTADADVAAQAREMYRQSVAAEMPVSGADLGKVFDRSDSWGRIQIRAVKKEDAERAAASAGATGTDGRNGRPEAVPERNPEAEGPAQPEGSGGTTGTEGRNEGGTEGPVSGPDLAEREAEPEPETDEGWDSEAFASHPLRVAASAQPDAAPADLAVLAGGISVPDSGSVSAGAAVAGVSVVPESGAAGAAEPSALPVAVPATSVVRRGDRALAWAAFLLGSAASIAGNVGHADGRWQAQLSGAFWPVALIVSVELMSRPLWRTGKGWSWARYGGTGLVAVVTAITSYWHMRGFLIKYGEAEALASVGPLAVDGLMIVAGFALLAIGKRSKTEDR